MNIFTKIRSVNLADWMDEKALAYHERRIKALNTLLNTREWGWSSEEDVRNSIQNHEEAIDDIQKRLFSRQTRRQKEIAATIR